LNGQREKTEKAFSIEEMDGGNTKISRLRLGDKRKMMVGAPNILSSTSQAWNNLRKALQIRCNLN